MVAIARSGTASMLKPFIENGIDTGEDNYLGYAAARGEMAIVRMLLDAGAATAPALHPFLFYENSLLSPKFQSVLTLLLEKVIPCGNDWWVARNSDPLNALLFLEAAEPTCYEGVKILVENGWVSCEHLYGSPGCELSDSYVFTAILRDRPHLLQLFFDMGFQVNCQIGHQFAAGTRFDGEEDEIIQYTWLSLAIEAGSVCSVEVLVNLGVDPFSKNGNDKSAIDLARSNAAADHPRRNLSTLCFNYGFSKFSVTEAEDAQILALLEKALINQAKGPKKSLLESGQHNEGQSSSCHSKVTRTCGFEGAPLCYFHCPVSVEPSGLLNKTLDKVRGSIWHRKVQRFIRKIRYQLWQFTRLTYMEALLIRIGVVVSYCILLFYQSFYIAIWLRNLPPPPRGARAAAVILGFAVMWTFNTRLVEF